MKIKTQLIAGLTLALVTYVSVQAMDLAAYRIATGRIGQPYALTVEEVTPEIVAACRLDPDCMDVSDVNDEIGPRVIPHECFDPVDGDFLATDYCLEVAYGGSI